MLRIILLISILITAIMTAWGAIYFYQCNKAENIIKDQLRERGIKGYARVTDKEITTHRRVNQSSGGTTTSDSHKFTLEYNMNYRPEDDSMDVKSYFKPLNDYLNQLNDPDFVPEPPKEKHVPLPKEMYEFTYNVGSKKYYNSYVGSRIPIMFLPDQPGAVEVLKEDGTIRSNSRYFSTYFLAAFSLLCFFLFFQYLITGKTI